MGPAVARNDLRKPGPGNGRGDFSTNRWNDRQTALTGSISGTVFEDLNADGSRDAGEQGLPGWTVVLERAVAHDIPQSGAGHYDSFGGMGAWLGDDILIGANKDDIAGYDTGAVYLYDGSTYGMIRTFLTRPQT